MFSRPTRAKVSETGEQAREKSAIDSSRPATVQVDYRPDLGLGLIDIESLIESDNYTFCCNISLHFQVLAQLSIDSLYSGKSGLRHD